MCFDMKDILDICLDLENALIQIFDTIDNVKRDKVISYVKDNLMVVYQYNCAIQEMLKE
jgi:hypothetical protein